MKKSGFIGLGILAFLLISYFIKIPVEYGPNSVTYSSLLGIVIFYNPIVLVVYVGIALFLIYKSIGRKIKIVS